MNRKIIFALLLLILAGIGVKMILRQTPPPAAPAMAAPDYDRYNYGHADEAKVIDFGIQPNGIFTNEIFFHDRILQKQLAAEGWTLRAHLYRNGFEMLPYCDGRLDVMSLGEIPAYIAMIKYNIGIFALYRQGKNTIVANRRITPSELKGLRIGYPANTTAHFTLERTLQSVNLTMNDITSVRMTPDEMGSAFHDNKVDAIVSWEPIASTLLALPGSAVVSASEGFTYIAIDLDFATRHPSLQKAILAAIVRAMNWSREDEKNIITNLLWGRDAAVIFFGKSPVEANQMWISLLRKETIDNPSFPLLPLNFANIDGIQHQQFEFLKKIGSLPATADWKTITNNVDTELLPRVIADKNWQTDRFDYSPDKLYESK